MFERLKFSADRAHRVLIAGILVCFLAGCATVSSPDGGPRDTIAPILLGAEPPQESVNVKPESIELTFNEFVALGDVFNEVLVSPPMEEAPDITVRRKSIIIDFNEPLKEDVTYTINFGEAIKDLNESNILQNFSYVFATGPTLDSLVTRGRLLNAEDLSPAEGILVSLYPGDSDSAFYLEKPWYFARTDATGGFEIGNIRADTYRIYALDDQNFNYRYDLPNESVAFLEEPIRVDTIVNSHELLLSREQPDDVALYEIRSRRYGKIDVGFSRPSPDSLVHPELPVGAFLLEQNKDGDTTFVWVRDTELDTVVLSIRLDSTVERKVVMPSVPRDSLLLKQELSIELVDAIAQKGDAIGPQAFDLGKPLIVELGSPLSEGVSVLEDSIRLLEDTTEFPVSVNVLRLDSIGRLFELQADLKPDMLYRLQIPTGTFTDLYGLSNADFDRSLKLRPATAYGKITMRVLVLDSIACLLMVYDRSGRMVRNEIFDGGSAVDFNWRYLKAGDYTFRIVYDLNGNGRWDPGAYANLRQPEPVKLFDQPASLRANWELEFEWSLPIP